MNDSYLHLSCSNEAAPAVGGRYRKPIALRVLNERTNNDEHLFFRSANGVWLTDCAPVAYISVPDAERPS